MDVVLIHFEYNEPFIKSYEKYIDKKLSFLYNFDNSTLINIQAKLIRENLPFVNKIYLVLPDDYSYVSNIDQDIVSIVFHKDILKRELLPCYNYNTIELNIHKISGLNERFILFNPYVFPTKPLNESSFFINDNPVYEVLPIDENDVSSIPTINMNNEMRLSLFHMKKHDIGYFTIESSVLPLVKSTCYYISMKLKSSISKTYTRTHNYRNISSRMMGIIDVLRNKYVSGNHQVEIPSDVSSITYNNSLIDISSIMFDKFDQMKKLTSYFSKMLGIVDDEFVDEDNHDVENDVKVALCTLAKKENRYVREWVEHHKKLGISKIFIYDNNDIDGERFDDVINDYIESGFVEVIDVRGDKTNFSYSDTRINIQSQCYIDCYENRCHDYEWVCFFDVDEFLSFKNDYVNISQYLHNETFDNYDTIFVSWEHYDDNDLLEYSESPVLERFSRMSKWQYYGVNSIVRTSGKIYNKTMKNLANYFILDTLKICYSDGTKCNPFNKDGKFKQSITSPKQVNDNTNVVLKYFRTKSLQEFIDKQLNKSYTTDELYKCYTTYFKYNMYSPAKDEYFKSHTSNTDYSDGVSICITAYKAKKYIKETLLSIQNQSWFKTHDNWECVVGIDGCQETLDYIKLTMNEFDYSHFSFYMMDSNKGTYITSNTLMGKIAKYKWLIRFDSDDIMHPDMVEKIMDAAYSENGIDIVRFHLKNFADENYTKNDTEKINKSYMAYGQICIKHESFNKFGGYLPWVCSADAEFSSRTRRFTKTVLIKEILFDRRITDNSLTNSEATDDKSEIRQKYLDYITSVSQRMKIEDEAMNKTMECNTYSKVVPYEFIISMTSFPARIRFVKDVLKSIVDTGVDRGIYKLVLVLSTEEFPEKEGSIPAELNEYCLSNNVEIIWHPRNIRSHKKLIPTILKYPSMPVLVIDDDILRTKDWLLMFINDHHKYPEDILCMRCDDYITEDFRCIHDRSNFENGVKFGDVIYHNRPSNGCGGVLYPAHTFRSQEFFNEDLLMKLSPSSDEMWQFCFNTMAKQTIRRTSAIYDVNSIKGSQEKSLYKENKGKYTDILRGLLEHFPSFKTTLENKLKIENVMAERIKKRKGVIAITSWKKRIGNLHKTIDNLLDYVGNKYQIVITLAIEEFPNKEADLPNELMKILNNHYNVEILWVYKNYKVFKKVLFAMQKYPTLPVISADDDLLYRYNYVDELYKEWYKNKKCVVSEGYIIKYTISCENYTFSRGCATLFPPSIMSDALKYLNNDIISTQNDDSFYGIYLHNKNCTIKNMHNNINSLIMQHSTNNAISTGVKGKESFELDKLNIFINIHDYKEAQ